MINLKNKHLCVNSTPYDSLKNKCRRIAILSFCCTALITTIPDISYASGYIPQEKLKMLAKDFVKKIGGGFNRADKKMRGESAELTIKENIQQSSIPVGEELILRILVGSHKIPLNFDIIAIKGEHDILISLSDFFATADMPISVNASSGIATGWFIRENQNFFLDVNKETATIIDKTIPITSDGVQIINGDIYATSYTLSQWFDMSFIFDFSELAILLTTSQALPAEEKYARSKKNLSKTSWMAKPKLPYQEQPYKIASIPSVDVNLRSSYDKTKGNIARRKQTWSAIGTGDLAYFSTQSFVSGDSDNDLNTARFTFSKESERPDLLGTLNATEYSFGDVYTTRLPLTGGSGQEQGFHFTNRDASDASPFSTTHLRGDAQPDWDVELYQNERLIENQTIDEDGTYNFEDIRLFIGDNDFRLVFYGPQGEIEERHESIPVDRNNTNKNNGSYDISLSRNNIVTYRNNKSNQSEDGKPHFVARYDKNLQDQGTLHAGIRHRQEGTDNKTYLEAGFSTKIKDALINIDTAVDANSGGAAIELTARKNIGTNALNMRTKINSDKFTPGGLNTNPTIFETDLAVNGNLKKALGINSTYSITTKYSEQSEGNSKLNISGSLGTRVGNTIVSSSLSYNNKKDAIGDKNDIVNGSINMHGFYKQMRLRFRSDYNITPETDINTVFGSVAYPFSKKIDGLFEVEHFLNSSLTKATASLNWKTDKATISPRLRIDTDDTIEASVSARFGIGYEPINGGLSMFNKSVSNSGGVAARVFLDKNGDGIFGEEDELLPDVELDAVQTRKSALTNKKGIAFLLDIPRGQLTDIKLDKGSFEDPFWIPSYKGLSIKPRPGVITTLDFPLTVAGEIDGTVYLKNKDGKKKIGQQYTVRLFTPHGKFVQKTIAAYDGFYIFSTVPAGTYFLTIDANDARQTGYTSATPERIEIKPDGTTIYGKDIVLQEGPAIDYLFTSPNAPSVKTHSIPANPITYTAGIILGQHNSSLAMTLAWYKLKTKHRDIGRLFEPMTPVSKIELDPQTNKYMIRLKLKNNPVLDINTAEKMCKKIAALNLPCTIEIISHYAEEVASAE